MWSISAGPGRRPSFVVSSPNFTTQPCPRRPCCAGAVRRSCAVTSKQSGLLAPDDRDAARSFEPYPLGVEHGDVLVAEASDNEVQVVSRRVASETFPRQIPQPTLGGEVRRSLGADGHGL